MERNMRITDAQTVSEALEIFSSANFRTLPVVNREGLFLGVLSLTKLINLPKESANVPISQFVGPCRPVAQRDAMLDKMVNRRTIHDILPVVRKDLLVGFYRTEDIYFHAYLACTKKVNEYSQVTDSAYNGIVAIDAYGNIVVYNPAAERILQRKKEDVFGKHISCIDPASGLLETLRTCESSVGMKSVVNGFTIMTNRTPVIHDGRCIGAVGVFLDISDFEKASHELNAYKELSQELNSILESSYDGLYICDRNGKVVRVNTSWERMTGLDREFVVGKTAKELVEEGWYDNSAAMMTLESKKVSSTMLKITSGPKKGQIIMATGTPIFTDEEELSQVVVNVRDITDLENLKARLEETTELSKRYARELEEIRHQFQQTEDIVVKSPEMQKIIELVFRVSKVNSTVMITGESGVGKDVIAKKIHYLSNRREDSFIKINCGAIPENLLESELFGYEGGAFTGAKKDGKPGMFELASGGTLFLDEIGDMPLALQVKLLKVLQEGEVVRVGGIKTIKVDVRIIAATNRDLETMVQKGSFRKDLFYRLNVVNILIPPLRNRHEDLEYLLGFILNKLNEKYGMRKRLSQPTIEKLLQYDWPGNVRELENMLERLVVLTDEQLIQVRHLPAFLGDADIVSEKIKLSGIIPLKEAVEELEVQLLKRALNEHGSTRKVAKALGVNQSTIVRKLNQYNLQKNDAPQHLNDA